MSRFVFVVTLRDVLILVPLALYLALLAFAGVMTLVDRVRFGKRRGGVR